MIKNSLEDCGAGRSILIDNENEIIAGNGVYEQAKKLGLPVKVVETKGDELIVVKRTDLKTADKKRRQLAVMDNTTSDSSEFDIEKLEADFGFDELGDFGIEGIAYIMECEQDIPDADKSGEGEGEGGRSSSSAEAGEDYADNGEDDENAYAGENQRIIICYKKADKEKLEHLLGFELNKILYSLREACKLREEEKKYLDKADAEADEEIA